MNQQQRQYSLGRIKAECAEARRKIEKDKKYKPMPPRIDTKEEVLQKLKRGKFTIRSCVTHGPVYDRKIESFIDFDEPIWSPSYVTNFEEKQSRLKALKELEKSMSDKIMLSDSEEAQTALAELAKKLEKI